MFKMVVAINRNDQPFIMEPGIAAESAHIVCCLRVPPTKGFLTACRNPERKHGAGAANEKRSKRRPQ